MKLRHVVAVATVLAGLSPAERAVTQDVGAVDASLLEAFTYRNMHPFRLGVRIADIAIPDSPAKDHLYTIYVAPWTGGIFKSTNNGTTFEAIFDNVSRRLTVGALAISHSDPDIVWAGTGDAFTSRSSYAGDGVYKSTDAGLTWTNMGLHDSHHIARIRVHPGDPNVVYVAAMGHLYSTNEERGVFKTTDGGESWEKLLYINENVGVIDLVMNPLDPDVLYAATYEKIRRPHQLVNGGPESGIYKTTDGGRNWTRLAGGLPDGRIGRIGLDIFLADPDVLYAIIENVNPAPGATLPSDPGERYQTVGSELFRTSDGGLNWTKTHADDYNPSSKGPYYFNQVRVHPKDDQQVFLTGSPGGLSRDGGRTFERIFSGFFGDNRSFWFDPENPDRMIMSSDGGISISYDGGQTSDHAPSLPLGEIYFVGIDMEEPYNVYVGLQDHEHWKAPHVSPRVRGIAQDDWFALGDGDGFYVEVPKDDSRWLYTTRHYGGHARLDQVEGHETAIVPPNPPSGDPYRWVWAPPIHISPHDSRVLYTGGQKMLRSRDRGDTWEEISPVLSTNPRDKFMPQSEGGAPGGIPWFTMSTISESPLTPGVIWAGLSDGKVHVTQDNGATWTDVTAKLTDLGGLEEGYVSRVRASSHLPGRAYVSKSGYKFDVFRPFLYVTDDFGATWKDIGSNLPPEPINVVWEDDRNPDLLFVGNDVGLYVSLDRGGHWTRMNNNMPNIPVHDVVVHPRDRDLVVGTYGRGVWLTNVAALQELNESVLASEVHMFEVPPTVQRVLWSFGANDYLNGQKYIQTPNGELGMAIRYFLREGAAGPAHITVTNAAGQVVAELVGESGAGIHTVVWSTRRDGEFDRGRGVGTDPLGIEELWVPLGEYTVTLEVGGRTLTRTAQITKTQGWSLGLQPKVIR